MGAKGSIFGGVVCPGEVDMVGNIALNECGSMRWASCFFLDLAGKTRLITEAQRLVFVNYVCFSDAGSRRGSGFAFCCGRIKRWSGGVRILRGAGHPGASEWREEGDRSLYDAMRCESTRGPSSEESCLYGRIAKE